MGYDRDYGGDPRGRRFFERAGDEVRSWFGDDEAERRRRLDERYDDRVDHERHASTERGAYRGPPAASGWYRLDQDEFRRGGYREQGRDAGYRFVGAPARDRAGRYADEWQRGYDRPRGAMPAPATATSMAMPTGATAR